MNIPWLLLPLRSVLDTLMPRTCQLCHRELADGEDTLCLSCLLALPRISSLKPDNPAAMRVTGHFPFLRGASFCYYAKESNFAHLLHEAKYNHKPWVNYHLATQFAAELAHAGWQQGIDLIIPVPISRRRQRQRGYNQSAEIVRALSAYWHIDYDLSALERVGEIGSQVGRNYTERLEIFGECIRVTCPDRLRGRHILLVDDVMTSGATLSVCARALLQVQSVSISFLTLGLSS